MYSTLLCCTHSSPLTVLVLVVLENLYHNRGSFGMKSQVQDLDLAESSVHSSSHSSQQRTRLRVVRQRTHGERHRIHRLDNLRVALLMGDIPHHDAEQQISHVARQR